MLSLFLVSRGIFRPSLRARTRLAALFSASEEICVVTRAPAREILCRLDPAQTPAAILYYNRRRRTRVAQSVANGEPERGGEPKPEPGYEKLLDDYLLAGGGLLVIGDADMPHGAGSDRVPSAPILIRQVNEFSRVFDGVGNFELRDAVFIQADPGAVDVHFDAIDSAAAPRTEDAGIEKAAVPVVWTRYRGKGRLCYLGLQLRAASLAHPAVQKIILQAVEWLLAGRRGTPSV